MDKSYIYKLIPDYSYVSYYEKEYWTKHASESDSYTSSDFLFTINFNHTNDWKDANAYRALFFSEAELNFPSTIITQKLSPFSGRNVYVAFADDDELYKESIKYKISDGTNSEVLILRF